MLVEPAVVVVIPAGQAVEAVAPTVGASLGFWGFLAGRRAGLTGWPLTGTVAFGLIIGIVVLVHQVVLQPGRAYLGWRSLYLWPTPRSIVWKHPPPDRASRPAHPPWMWFLPSG
jgi:hypothetical protein